MLFAEIPGLNNVKQRLIESVQNNRVSHAQLFHGTEGCSAFQMAQAYAQYLVCANPGAEDSCGTCAYCKQFAVHSFPDLHYSFPYALKKGTTSKTHLKDWVSLLEEQPFFTIEDWTSKAGFDKKSVLINVEEALAINKNLVLRSYSGKYKIQLIYHADLLNAQAANTLLKNIEEPEPNTLVLMTSDNVEQFLPTILSRCQKVFIPRHGEGDIAQYLKQKKPGFSEQEIKQVAFYANGSLVEAYNMLNNLKDLTQRSVVFADWFRACYKALVKDIQASTTPLLTLSRDQLKAFLVFASSVVHAGIRMKLFPQQKNPLFENVQFNQTAFSDLMHTKNAHHILNLLEEAIDEVGRNINPRIMLLDLSLKLSNALRMKED